MRLHLKKSTHSVFAGLRLSVSELLAKCECIVAVTFCTVDISVSLSVALIRKAMSSTHDRKSGVLEFGFCVSCCWLLKELLGWICCIFGVSVVRTWCMAKLKKRSASGIPARVPRCVW